MAANQSENVPPHPAHPPHYLHELPQEDEERIGKIFSTLDLDGNGKIDIYDLSAALKEFGVSHYDAQVRYLKIIIIIASKI
jgi:solute carrier family 25 phosphate transporter 23/24/25/41